MSFVLPRRFPIGAELSDAGVDFRVWAPDCSELEIVFDSERPARSMRKEEGGYFRHFEGDARAGTLYRFRIPGDSFPIPDPASRFQPQGPKGPSAVIDPFAFAWTDARWKGLSYDEGQIFYELHVGSFTTEGTWAAAAEKIPYLRDLGITCIEMLPVAEFPGDFGWGYDGVDLFAPYRGYGTPDDLRRFVDRAHAHGLGVILDVVYNHFGPDGNFLRKFAKGYFSDKYSNEWGDPLDFETAPPVRDFFISNARLWIEEYRFDGFRFDALQSIHDASPTHVMAEVVAAARASAAPRPILCIAEDERQNVHGLARMDARGIGLDALWNDDFHHSWRVALTGGREAYYEDYAGTADEVAALTEFGFLYQGQMNRRQGGPRGTVARDVPQERLIAYLQNHDQVANSGGGRRLQFLTSIARVRAATTALLLLPSTPLLFQGQEFGASTPFQYFADHEPKLAALVARGRHEFLSQFPSQKDPRLMATPHDPATLARSRLDWSEARGPLLELHRELIALRKKERVRTHAARVRAFPIGADAVAYRWYDTDNEDRLLVVNLGKRLASEDVQSRPILVPPPGSRWEPVFASEDPRYGGAGLPVPDEHGEWGFAASSAVYFHARGGHA